MIAVTIFIEKYVVLDVETNGLSSLNDDLLSISIYQPDTQKLYNRFLPLELDIDVWTTPINGITKKDLKDAVPLSQYEVDTLIEEYDLCNRIILTYGGIDERFIKNYFKRKGLCGYEKMHFFNFKRNIISSRYSNGNITKDNLCRLYDIDNVQEIHTGANDCILEWELFKKLDGKKLLITDNAVYEFNNDYIVPASYLTTYPNFKYHIQNLPRIKCTSKLIKQFDIMNTNIRKFPTNFNGMTIEHLINTMLGVEKIDSLAFLEQNKRKLKYIGRLPSPYDEIYMNFMSDGTVNAVKNKDKELAKELNEFILSLKAEISPLIRYIKEYIFKEKHILSQELVLHRDKNVLALCDLSNDAAVLEIKTYDIADFNKVGNQLFYQSKGRDCYVMQIKWSLNKKKMSFIFLKIEFELDDSLPADTLESRITKFKDRISNKKVDVLEYVDSRSKVVLRCLVCGSTYARSYATMLKKSECPDCNPSSSRKAKQRPKVANLSFEEKQARRSQKYFEKINRYSAGKVSVLAYCSSKEKLTAHCNECGNEWDIRADHLLRRAYCPLCKKSNR